MFLYFNEITEILTQYFPSSWHSDHLIAHVGNCFSSVETTGTLQAVTMLSGTEIDSFSLLLTHVFNVSVNVHVLNVRCNQNWFILAKTPYLCSIIVCALYCKNIYKAIFQQAEFNCPYVLVLHLKKKHTKKTV